MATENTKSNTMTTTDNPIDVSGQAGNVLAAKNRIRNHYKATHVDVETDDANYEVTIQLAFFGFEDIDSALEKISTVATDLDSYPEVIGVDTSVTTRGVYSKANKEHDDRPAGWVDATFKKRNGKAIATKEEVDREVGRREVASRSNSNAEDGA